MSELRMTDLEATVRVSLPCDPATFARLLDAFGRPQVRSLTIMEYAGVLPEKVLNINKQLLHTRLNETVYVTITGGLSAMQVVRRALGAMPYATPDYDVAWAHYLFTFPPECADPAVKFITAMQARPPGTRLKPEERDPPQPSNVTRLARCFGCEKKHEH